MRIADTSAPRIGFGVSLALHAMVAAATLGYWPARNALPAPTPIRVNLISPPNAVVRPSTPAIGKSKPGPAAKLAAPARVSAPGIADRTEAPPAVVASPLLSNPTPQPHAVAEPAPVTAPVFDASYLENPEPAYPALSRRLGEQGRVILRVLVNAGGTTDEVQLRASSGHGRLDEAARDTVRRWKFVPARNGAEPCAAWVLVPISFRLEG